LNITVAAEEAKEKLGSFGDVANKARDILGNFDNKLQSIGATLNNTGSLSEAQVAKFGLLSAAIVGVRKSFTDFADGANGTHLNTFTQQISDLSSFLGDGKNAISALTKVAVDSFGKAVPDAVIKQGLPAVKTFVLNLAESADNALRLQSGFIQLAAKTGNLGQVYGAAGPHLSKMNLLLAQQQVAITDTIKATGLAPAAVEQYYAALGTVPKAMESVVAGSQSGNRSISMLTATIQLSTGSGRKYSEVIDDLQHAFRTYNISGEEALKFTARMSEISNRYGVELDDVRSSLRGTADAFKLFGNEAEGASRIMNNYLGLLQNTGLSGKASVEVVSNMTRNITGLTLAQKAFLSAQTGGPGGLMGGFQIEKMLRDGKVDEVFEKVRQQMQKQFGNIVTLDDASKTPQAAAQLAKQMTILKSGPLGQFAKSDQEAFRILEAFKGRAEGKTPKEGLSDTVVKDTMQKGNDIQKQSYTELTRIRGLIEANRGVANVANLGTIQEQFTAAVGSPMNNPMGDIGAEMRDNLSQSRNDAAVASGRTAGQIGLSLETGRVTDIAGTAASNVITDYKKFFEELPASLKVPLQSIKNLFSKGNTTDAVTESEALLKDIERRKQEAQRLTKNARDNELKKLANEESIAKRAIATFSQQADTKPATEVMVPLPPGANNPRLPFNANQGRVTNAGARVAQATVTAATVPPPPGSAVMTAEASQKIKQERQEKHDITVHVTGYCIKCKRDIEGSPQAKSINPAATSDY
jgi:stringent starvation protein B